MCSLACLEVTRQPMAREVHTLANSLVRLMTGGILPNMEAESSFLEEVKTKQFRDGKLGKIRDKVLQGEAKETTLDDEGVLNKGMCMCPSGFRFDQNYPVRSS